jgi:hypothetical protein
MRIRAGTVGSLFTQKQFFPEISDFSTKSQVVDIIGRCYFDIGQV